MAHLDLDLLHTFLTVAEEGSISQAAGALEVTQPAVTKKIKRLEAALGTTLINRTARPLAMTEAGKLLRARAPLLLRDSHAISHVIMSLGKGGLPLLRLGMPDSLSEIMGAEFIGSIKGLARQIELKSGISPWLETAFKSRHFDLAVDFPPLSEDEMITLRPLFRDPYVIAIPKSFPESTLHEIIASENFVSYGRSSKFGAECTSIMGRLGIDSAARFNFDSTQSLVRFVQAGYGWAITTAFCLLQSPAAIKNIRVLPCPESTPREFHLLHRTGELDSVAETASTKFRGVFSQLVDGPWAQLAPETAAMIREANSDLGDLQQ